MTITFHANPGYNVDWSISEKRNGYSAIWWIYKDSNWDGVVINSNKLYIKFHNSAAYRLPSWLTLV